MSSATLASAVLPSDKIVVSNGCVVQYKRWMDWNGVHWPVTNIKRIGSNKFESEIGDPSGGAVRSGTLDEALEGLHEIFQKKYRALFSLQNASAESIRALGFLTEKIEFPNV